MSALSGSPSEYAPFLRTELQLLLRFELPESFERLFVWHANRLGPASHEDLASLLFLECQTRPCTRYEDVMHALDAIRHRLVRELTKEKSREHLGLGEPEWQGAGGSPEELRLALQDFLTVLSATEAVAFTFFCEGARPEEIAERLGLSRATAYRALKSAKAAFLQYLQET
jgi:AcrR family transcriptional regulator